MFRKAMVGDGSTLNLDFTTMTATADLTARGLTFTRGSTGTRINASGFVETMSNNVARFDHNPTTLAPKGLLVEGTATNLVTYSDLRTTGWAGINATGTNDNATAPDNTTTATLWTGTSGGINRAYSAGFSVTSGTTYTISAWVKKPSSNAARYAKIDVRSSIEGLIGWPSNGTLDLDTGTISGTGYTVTPYQNGWYRIVSTGTVNATTTARMFVRITDASGGEPTVTTALLWWGAQAETGSGASSLIPTGASQGTRNADSCVMTGTNFSSWFAGATEGVLYAECERPRKIMSPAVDHGIVGSQYQSGGWLAISATATNQYPAAVIFPTGGFQFAGGIATQIPLVSKQAVRWFDANDITNFANGTQGTTNTAGTGTVTPAMLTIGANSTSGAQADLDWLNACVRRVKFWPVALPNSQIIALTTP
jgi:hypothetical protein